MQLYMAWFMFLFHIILSIIAEATEGQTVPKPDCPEKCGSVEIPYPFGIGTNCSLNEGFALSCNSSQGTMVPFFYNVEVLNITLSTAEARMYNPISWQCYLGSGNTSNSTSWLNLIDTVYRLSEHQNRFTVIGCETLAFNEMWDYNDNPYRTGCVSTCYSPETLRNGSCSGNGCCQTSIPSGINYYQISFDKNYNSSQVWNFSHCSYAVIMATDSFNFSTSYISTIDFWLEHNGSVPVILNWSIENKTCNVAQANLSSYACVSNNSKCVDSTNGPGYYCNCSPGYEGNPYLQDGCQDIDECKEDPPICKGFRICQNTQGSHQCNCPDGTRSDTADGDCYSTNKSLSPQTKLAIGKQIIPRVKNPYGLKFHIEKWRNCLPYNQIFQYI